MMKTKIFKFKHVRTLKKIKTQRYQGFKIEFYVDQDRYLPYNAVIVPINSSAKRICSDKRHVRFDQVLDYTGWRNLFEARRDKIKQIELMKRVRNFRYHYLIKDFH